MLLGEDLGAGYDGGARKAVFHLQAGCRYRAFLYNNLLISHFSMDFSVCVTGLKGKR